MATEQFYCYNCDEPLDGETVNYDGWEFCGIRCKRAYAEREEPEADD